MEPLSRMDSQGGTFEDFREILARLLALLAGAIFLQIGLHFRTFLSPVGSWVNLGAVFLLYGTGIGLVIIGLIDLRGLSTHPALRYGSVAVVTLVAFVTFISQTSGPRMGTDGILFARYSVDLLLSGHNPYAQSMAPAFEQYPAPQHFVTYMRDGGVVSSLSYPAMSLWLFVPQIALGIPNINVTTILVLLIVLLFLVWRSPPFLGLAPFVIMFGDPSLVIFSYGGVFDIFWVFPMLISMALWARGRLALSMFILGLAFAVKQTPWLVAPFLAVWIIAESQGYRTALRRLGVGFVAGLGGFLLPNLPFILWDAHAWFRSVMTPIVGGSSLVKQGVGLTYLSTSGLVSLPKDFYTATVLIILLLSLAIYSLYFGRLRWSAWVMPALILWFSYRSLQNYFVYFLPIAYFAIVLAYRTSANPVLNTQLSEYRLHGLPDRTRRRLLAGIGALGFAAVGGAAAVTSMDELDVNLELVDARDPTEIRQITELVIRVSNSGSQAIEPLFHGLHSDHQTHSYWRIESGPDQLPPGASAEYTIQPETATFGIPDGAQATIRLSDGEQEPDATLSVGSVNLTNRYENVLNPTFKWWNIHDLTSGNYEPFRWQQSVSNPGEALQTLDKTDNGFRAAVSRVSRDTGPWSMVGVLQQAPFQDYLRIEATPETVLNRPTIHPPHPNGVEIGEGRHRVWIVFANIDERTRAIRSGELTYVLEFIPAEPGQQVSVTVDLAEIYNQMGWKTPEPVTVNLDDIAYSIRPVNILAFAAVYPESDPELRSSIHFHRISSG